MTQSKFTARAGWFVGAAALLLLAPPDQRMTALAGAPPGSHPAFHGQVNSAVATGAPGVVVNPGANPTPAGGFENALPLPADYPPPAIGAQQMAYAGDRAVAGANKGSGLKKALIGLTLTVVAAVGLWRALTMQQDAALNDIVTRLQLADYLIKPIEELAGALRTPAAGEVSKGLKSRIDVVGKLREELGTKMDDRFESYMGNIGILMSDKFGSRAEDAIKNVEQEARKLEDMGQAECQQLQAKLTPLPDVSNVKVRANELSRLLGPSVAQAVLTTLEGGQNTVGVLIREGETTMKDAQERPKFENVYDGPLLSAKTIEYTYLQRLSQLHSAGSSLLSRMIEASREAIVQRVKGSYSIVERENNAMGTALRVFYLQGRAVGSSGVLQMLDADIKTAQETLGTSVSAAMKRALERELTLNDFIKASSDVVTSAESVRELLLVPEKEPISSTLDLSAARQQLESVVHESLADAKAQKDQVVAIFGQLFANQESALCPKAMENLVQQAKAAAETAAVQHTACLEAAASYQVEGKPELAFDFLVKLLQAADRVSEAKMTMSALQSSLEILNLLEEDIKVNLNSTKNLNYGNLEATPQRAQKVKEEEAKLREQKSVLLEAVNLEDVATAASIIRDTAKDLVFDAYNGPLHDKIKEHKEHRAAQWDH